MDKWRRKWDDLKKSKYKKIIKTTSYLFPFVLDLPPFVMF